LVTTLSSGRLSVFDAQGRLQYSQPLPVQAGLNHLRLSPELPAGLYWVKAEGQPAEKIWWTR
ncbi:MAG TPA: hypothetical protein PK858_09890, partial [Saprospiraceae bacterium]|nr:hypothetical protein [Saprospiraceae bacterium]